MVNGTNQTMYNTIDKTDYVNDLASCFKPKICQDQMQASSASNCFLVESTTLLRIYQSGQVNELPQDAKFTFFCWSAVLLVDWEGTDVNGKG